MRSKNVLASSAPGGAARPSARSAASGMPLARTRAQNAAAS